MKPWICNFVTLCSVEKAASKRTSQKLPSSRHKVRWSGRESRKRRGEEGKLSRKCFVVILCWERQNFHFVCFLLKHFSFGIRQTFFPHCDAKSVIGRKGNAMSFSFLSIPIPHSKLVGCLNNTLSCAGMLCASVKVSRSWKWASASDDKNVMLRNAQADFVTIAGCILDHFSSSKPLKREQLQIYVNSEFVFFKLLPRRSGKSSSLPEKQVSVSFEWLTSSKVRVGKQNRNPCWNLWNETAKWFAGRGSWQQTF